MHCIERLHCPWRWIGHPIGRCVARPRSRLERLQRVRLALAAQHSPAYPPHVPRICDAYPLNVHCIYTTALEMRKILLELEVSSGKIEMPGYLARVAASLEAEKAAAKAHKAAGQTALALHAMKRAKIMSDEIAAARETGAE